MFEENSIAIFVGRKGHKIKTEDALSVVRENGGKIGVVRNTGFLRPAFTLEYYGDSKIGNSLRKKFKEIADVAILPPINLKKKLLLADMDSTIIEQECLDELASYARVKDQVAAITMRAMNGELDFEEALRERVAMLKGLSIKSLEECWRNKITISSGAQILVRTMRSQGARCVLVSGGFTFFTSRVADLVGFDAHFGNSLIDDGEKLTGEIAEPILGKESKLKTLFSEAERTDLSLSETVTIGDGANDLAMIEAAGLGVAVHAKPIVAESSDAEISKTDLASVLYFQGYQENEFVNKF